MSQIRHYQRRRKNVPRPSMNSINNFSTFLNLKLLTDVSKCRTIKLVRERLIHIYQAFVDTCLNRIVSCKLHTKSPGLYAIWVQTAALARPTTLAPRTDNSTHGLKTVRNYMRKNILSKQLNPQSESVSMLFPPMR